MENIKQQLLTSIGNVYDQSKDCKQITDVFDKIDTDLTILSEYFQVTKNQSFFIAMVFTLNYKGISVDINDLVVYFDCNPTKILEFSDDFDELQSRGILIKKKSNHKVFITFSNYQYTVNRLITDAIMQNKPMPNILKKDKETVFEVLEELYSFCQLCEDGKIDTYELFEKAQVLILNSLQYPLIHWVYNLNLEIVNQYLYLYMIWKNVIGKRSIDLGIASKEIFGNNHLKAAFIQSILASENEMLSQDLIQIVEASFFDDTELKLTQKSLKKLQDFGIKLFANTLNKENIISPSKTPIKELVFNAFENKQIEMLKNMLNNEMFIQTQTRLEEKGLPKGIAILLHGSPGTGKTEVVYQLAKATNREIFKVEISKSKSMWFGESEKLIKRIFKDYTNFAKECEQMPILLFNEADAIISKRLDVNSSGVAKTENAIQNILLEELENFQGILFATTNLVNNIDTAFERRFLFKIEFSKPTIENRSKIWKLKINQLTDSECMLIAQSFDFSGGQIENITRKYNLFEVINGCLPKLKDVMGFCESEKMGTTNHSAVGFVLKSNKPS